LTETGEQTYTLLAYLPLSLTNKIEKKDITMTTKASQIARSIAAKDRSYFKIVRESKQRQSQQVSTNSQNTRKENQSKKDIALNPA